MEDKKQPFNDVIDHFNKIEGNAVGTDNAKINRLPKSLKFIGFMIVGYFILSIVLMVIFNLIN
ncbi:hypothetical protein [Rummeliibacillus stabekisii]|uniref:hypothetical protein n=1 Tax=Rummeliibacillus stabekisii TaxID=241244 RepID=UPI003719A6C7